MMNPRHAPTLALLCALSVMAAAPLPALENGSAVVLDGVPSPDTTLGPRLARYLAARAARFLDWLPDGGLLIATRFGDTEQLHRIAGPLATREQLTWFGEPVTNARVPQVANATGFVFLADHAGDENAQIYYYRFADRSVRLLTDGKSAHGSVQWSRDGRRIAYYGTDRDGASYDVYVAEPEAGGAPRLVLSGQNAAWYPLDWSPGGTQLLVLKATGSNAGELYLVDVASGALTAIDVGIGGALFAPDSRGVYLISDKDSEFRQLRYYDTVTRAARVVSVEGSADVTGFDVSADGRYVAYVTGAPGASRLTVIDNLQRSELALAPLPAGAIGRIAFDRAGKRLALSVDALGAPRDAYVYELERGALARWTQSEPGPIDPRAVVSPELVHYPSWDRVGGAARAIPAFIYRPATATATGTGTGMATPATSATARSPVLILLGGEVDSAGAPGFDPFVQFLVNELGFVVVSPQVRGSAGFGKAFRRLGAGTLREDAVRDVGALLVWLGVQPECDRERIFIAGDSYGGYLALAAFAAYGDRLRGAIDRAGISNFVTFLEHSPPHSIDGRRAEFGDERDPHQRAYLQHISPLTNAASIRNPVLIVQGLNDARVPASESSQLAAALRARGREVWFLTAGGEGHRWAKQTDREIALLTEASFLERLATEGGAGREDTPALRNRPEH